MPAHPAVKAADPAAGLRIRLPATADRQAAREALDSALRLLGVDLHDRCAPFMPTDWELRPVTGFAVDDEDRFISPHDPVEWLRGLRKRGHPVQRAVPTPHKALLRDVKRVIGYRHELYHFTREHDLGSAHAALSVMYRVADRLRLPCRREIDALRQRLAELAEGHDEPPTVAEVDELVHVVDRLRSELATAAARHERAQELVDRVRDELVQAEARVAGVPAREGEGHRERDAAVARVASLEAELLRLEQEAQIKARHEEMLAEQADRLEESIADAPQLPATERAYLAHYYAALAGFLLLRRARAESGDGSRVDDLDRSFSEFAELRLAQMDRLGVSQEHLGPDAEIDAAWVVAHARTAARLTAVAARSPELARLDKRSRRTLKQLRKDCRTFATMFASVAQDRSWQPASAPLAGHRQRALAPGDPWPYERGDGIWMLSALTRQIHRPGGRRGSLADEIGAEPARRVTEAFLTLRPEGGRIYVDENGDVCSHGEHGLMYLGNLFQL